jgi:hypothetical protein
MTWTLSISCLSSVVQKALRKLAAPIGVLPHATLVAQIMKDELDDCVIIPHSNATKPTLNDHHKFERFLYAIDIMNLVTEKYHANYDCSVHVDEKWSFLMEAELSMYIVPGDAPPIKSTQHKSHILKVIFLATIATSVSVIMSLGQLSHISP